MPSKSIKPLPVKEVILVKEKTKPVSKKIIKTKQVNQTKSISINQIDDAIEHAFKLTIRDYLNKMIELEEDFRACIYHHLRPFIDKHKELRILLSHNVKFKTEVIKPDIIIFRKNDYLVGIEIKLNPTLDGGKSDIKRLEDFSPYLRRGYYIHITKNMQPIRKTRSMWKDNYYRELCYISSTNHTTVPYYFSK